MDHTTIVLRALFALSLLTVPEQVAGLDGANSASDW